MNNKLSGGAVELENVEVREDEFRHLLDDLKIESIPAVKIQLPQVGEGFAWALDRLWRGFYVRRTGKPEFLLQIPDSLTQRRLGNIYSITKEKTVSWQPVGEDLMAKDWEIV